MKRSNSTLHEDDCLHLLEGICSEGKTAYLKHCLTVPEFSTISLSSCLHLACRRGHLDTVKTLLEKIPRDQVDDREPPTYLTTFHQATMQGNLPIMEELANKGADIEATVPALSIMSDVYDDLTPFHLACLFNHVDCMKWLMTRGANVLAKEEKYQQTALHLTAKEGDKDIVKILLETKKFDINEEAEIGGSPLDLAILHKRTEMIQYLLQNGAKFSDPDNVKNILLLGDQPLITWLFSQQELDMDQFIKEDPSLLSRIIKAKRPDDVKLSAIQLLIKKGISLENSSFLMAAEKDSNSPILECLISQVKGTPQFKDLCEKVFDKALSSASYTNIALLAPYIALNSKPYLALAASYNIQLELLPQELGALVNTQDASGKTALHHAVLKQNQDNVKFLIAQGADFKLVDGEGNTALQIAKKMFNGSKIIRSNGKSKGKKTHCGRDR